MNDLQKSFIYLSQIINFPVVDFSTNKKIGKVVDLSAVLREMYPKISGLIIRGGKKRKKFYLPWKNVKKIIENDVVYVDGLPPDAENNIGPGEGEILLKEIFWDKQIVDISGCKVVRVNDLHLLREEPNLWVVHMDVGYKGLLRRLGCLKFFTVLFRLLFSYELKDKLISWKYVQPITDANINESLHLKVHQSKLSELLPADLADILINLGTDEREIIFRSLDNSAAAKTLEELPLKIRIQVAESLQQPQLANILNEMPMDEVVDLIAELSKKKMNQLLTVLPKEKVSQIKELLLHSPHIAGSIMNTSFIAVKHNSNVGEVLEKIKTESKKTETIYYVYVLDDNNSLTGVVSLRQLLTFEPAKPVSEFMYKKMVKVKIDTNIKKVARIFLKYNFTVLPVVDKHNRMLGTITVKDAIESVFPEIREKVGD